MTKPLFLKSILGLILTALPVVAGGPKLSQLDGTQQRDHPISQDFTLTAIDGSSLRLSAYRGSVVLLDFWATWCAPCLTEIPSFVRMQEKYRGQGLKIIGVSMDDDADLVRDFVRLHKVNYPVAMGNVATAELYGGILGLPTAFLIDRDGSVKIKYVGAVNLSKMEKDISTLLQKSQP